MHTTRNTTSQAARNGESGNVLFLILIAVALFAALSYAVTQSSRSGSNDANKETSLVNSSTITQYPAGVRTDLVRMLISGGQAAADLEFNPPSDFGSGKPIDDTVTPLTDAVKNAVFHPSGGGAIYQQAPPDVMASGLPGNWDFSQKYAIPNIGSSANDLVAYLIGVSKAVCTRIDEQLGILDPATSAIPTGTIAITAATDDQLYTSGAVTGTGIGTVANPMVTSVSGQPFACVSDGASPPVYTYYHVLVEQ